MNCPHCGKEIPGIKAERISGYAKDYYGNYYPVYGLPPLNYPAAVLKAIREKWEIEASKHT